MLGDIKDAVIFEPELSLWVTRILGLSGPNAITGFNLNEKFSSLPVNISFCSASIYFVSKSTIQVLVGLFFT